MGLRVVRRSGSPYWQIVGTIAGRRIRKSTKTSDRTAAVSKAKALEREYWKRRASGRKNVVTFDVASQAYRDADGETRFLDPLEAYFAGYPVADILPGHVHDAARELYPTAKPATWNRNVITPVRAVINHASERGWCSPIRIRRFEEKAPERKAADREWLDAFTAHADPTIAALAMFMFTTGARISDALSLRWGGIDGRQAEIQTKTGPRTVTLTREMVTRLQWMGGHPDRHPTRPFIYRGRDQVYPLWYAVCDAAGIERIPPHQAGRHAFATEMIVRHGIDAKTTAELGGWASPRMLMERYAHPEDTEAVVDAVFDAPKPRPASKQRHKMAKDQ